MNDPKAPSTRRIGKFRISTALARHDHEAILKAFLCDCFVVRCEMRYDTDSLHYTALSHHFEEYPIECVAPYYSIHFKKVNIGTEDAPLYETQLDRVEQEI